MYATHEIQIAYKRKEWPSSFFNLAFRQHCSSHSKDHEVFICYSQKGNLLCCHPFTIAPSWSLNSVSVTTASQDIWYLLFCTLAAFPEFCIYFHVNLSVSFITKAECVMKICDMCFMAIKFRLYYMLCNWHATLGIFLYI